MKAILEFFRFITQFRLVISVHVSLEYLNSKWVQLHENGIETKKKKNWKN